MISDKLNQLLTRVGPDDGAGQVLRHYWQPAALSIELKSQRPVVPVDLLGEQLVLFKDNSGELGLIARHCPHRGADLCYGRREDNGLRCPFHGWHFNRSGQCVEQPGEPLDSDMHTKIKLAGYPVVEKNGIVWAYLGPGNPPPFPSLDCFIAPESHVFAFKGLWDCNWLQAMEVGIDPVHASFLHRFLIDEDPADSYGKQFRDKAASADMPMTQLLREYARPEISVEETDYGLRLTALRHLDDGNTHVRVTNQIFPAAICIPISREMTITQWHVPIDNTSCYWYSMFTSFTEPVNKELMWEQRIKEHRLPDFAPLKNKSNNYGYNPQEQSSETYTGMGLDINVHDQWAVESMGTIQDRTKEHLATTDIAISKNRKLLRAAIESVDKNPGDLKMQNGTTRDITGPISVDTIAADSAWDKAYSEEDAKRRADCSWQA